MNHPVVESLGWSLIHSLWECALIALLFAIFNLLIRSANARYIAGCFALLLMLVVPAVSFFGIFEHAAITAAPAPIFASPVLEIAPETPVRPPIAASTPGAPSYLSIMVWLWLSGVIAMAAWSTAGWVAAQRLKRRSKQAMPEMWQRRLAALAARINVRRPVRLCQSVRAQVPAVIGWIRPVILVPAGALINLSAEELEAVLAHELAHIRRYDYLVNLAQTVVETLLFYHPAVWWVGRRVRSEREHCCDDLAVQACGNPLIYARALTSLEELRSCEPQFAMAASGGELSSRIRRLFGARQPVRRLLPFWLIAVIPVLMATLLFVNTRAASADTPVPSRHPVKTRPRATVAPPAMPAPRALESEDSTTPPPTPALALAEPEPGEPPTPALAPAQPGPATVPPTPVVAPVAPAELTPPPAIATAPVAPAALNVFAFAQPTPPPTPRAVAPPASAPKPAPVAPPAHRGEGFLAGLADAGYTNITVDEIIELKQNNVTPDYIKRMLQAGFGNLTPKELIKLRNNGVPTDYARAVRTAGLRDADVDGVIRLHQNGVRPELLEALAAAGYKDVTVSQAVNAQSNGLSGSALRSLHEQGFKSLTLEQVIKLKRAGVI